MALNLSFEPGAAIVAGGSGGIGAGICRLFAAAGVPVVFTYHSNADKARVIREEIEAAGGRCACERVDLTVSDEVEAFVGRVKHEHGRIAHVVYAAGPHFEFNFIGAIPDADWHGVVNADINGAFHLIQSAVRAFRSQDGGGNLVAVITAAVERVPVKDIMSAAPKAAIEMLVRGVARESGRFGIRANCVGPGWINAGLGKKGLEEKLDAATRDKTRKLIPLQRFGEADDIAWATAFLCSQQAGFVTGQSLAVDGGMQL
jgi:NAD(P)-dependent dehydrogenase (short-subunit alcohol dehydrogenase family)